MKFNKIIPAFMVVFSLGSAHFSHAQDTLQTYPSTSGVYGERTVAGNKNIRWEGGVKVVTTPAIEGCDAGLMFSPGSVVVCSSLVAPASAPVVNPQPPAAQPPLIPQIIPPPYVPTVTYQDAVSTCLDNGYSLYYQGQVTMRQVFTDGIPNGATKVSDTCTAPAPGTLLASGSFLICGITTNLFQFYDPAGTASVADMYSIMGTLPPDPPTYVYPITFFGYSTGSFQNTNSICDMAPVGG